MAWRVDGCLVGTLSQISKKYNNELYNEAAYMYYIIILLVSA